MAEVLFTKRSNRVMSSQNIFSFFQFDCRYSKLRTLEGRLLYLVGLSACKSLLHFVCTSAFTCTDATAGTVVALLRSFLVATHFDDHLLIFLFDLLWCVKAG